MEQARPSTAQVARLEEEIQELISRKAELDQTLMQLEVEIYGAETAYLEETGNASILKGLEWYQSNRTEKKRVAVKESDRVFSNSSASHQKALALSSRQSMEESTDDDKKARRRQQTSDEEID